MSAALDRAIREAIAELAPDLRDKFERAFKEARSNVRLEAVLEAIDEGRFDDALRELAIGPEHFASMVTAFVTAFTIGGSAVFASIPASQRRRNRVAIQPFNPHSRRARGITDQHAAGFINAMSSEAHALAFARIQAVAIGGGDPRKLTLDLVGRVNRATGLREGGYIGLSQAQANALDAIEQGMLTGNIDIMRGYLRRNLRDRTYDDAIRAAIGEKKPVNSTTVTRLKNRLASRMLRHRGSVIANHELRYLIHAGRHEAIWQLIDSGAIQERQVLREWDSRADSRVRDTHLAMHGQQRRGMSEPFQSPSGALMMFPHDTSLGAPMSEIAGCRCREKTRLAWE